MKELEEVLKMENIFLHLYGKKETRPGRKMGHATILSPEKSDLVYKAKAIKQKLRMYISSTPNLTYESSGHHYGKR